MTTSVRSGAAATADTLSFVPLVLASARSRWVRVPRARKPIVGTKISGVVSLDRAFAGTGLNAAGS